MEGRGRTLFFLIIVGGIGYWLYSHRAKDPSATAPSSSAAAPGAAGSTSGLACVPAAERANQQLHDAAMLLLRPPVDASAWSSAESAVSSAISEANSACSGGTGEAERRSNDEARAALSLMRSSVSDYANAARGGSGAAEASTRQGEIESHLEKARGR